MVLIDLCYFDKKGLLCKPIFVEMGFACIVAFLGFIPFLTIRHKCIYVITGACYFRHIPVLTYSGDIYIYIYIYTHIYTTAQACCMLDN